MYVACLVINHIAQRDDMRGESFVNDFQAKNHCTAIADIICHTVLLKCCLDYYIPLVHEHYVNEVSLSQDYIP